MRNISNVLSLSRKYLLKPYTIDDICYSLYTIFKDRATSIAYEKPNCSHMFIVGSNYEVRIFISSLREMQLNLLVDVGNIISDKIITFAQTMFCNIDRILSRFCETEGDIHVLFRSTFRCKALNIDDIEKRLSYLGVVVYSRELHTVSDIVLSVIRGKLVGRNLKRFDITVTFIENEESEISISVETDVDSRKPLNQIIEVQDILFSLIETLIADNNHKTLTKYR
ncbi:MAG: hypothetical protein QXL96_10130 [Ignisphaera sp.]